MTSWATTWPRGSTTSRCTSRSRAANRSCWADAARGPTPADQQVTGGSKPKPMDHFGNGHGDWNLSWEQWLAGSALGVRTGG
ncbi:hypothetical protein CYQ11_18315 [Streptomyces cinnamoneus]|nr:hypothetical protein CYQ11_18315 [Streptomyces cinnamoneus]